ncbi:ABC transporter substrate-binding protein [Hyphomicrobium sp.]|uniref:ABC transporter substrate-binding protein n=1 Tax=Hyphomicrobium sp. TaxID=82 RepID=UPI002FDDFAD2
MTTETKFQISRRSLLASTAVSALLPVVGFPRVSLAAQDVVKIGFLAPLTGPVAAWGKPGLDGCHIWADWVNAAGGLEIGGKAYKVEMVSYDDEDDAGKARVGATKLIRENDVKFIMMLGGNSWPGVEEISARQGMLFSTLLPSDLSPDTKSLIAPCEVHPIYNVTGVDWLAANKPELKTAVVCAQDDALGKPSVATYLAAFEAAGIKMASPPLFFDPDTKDFAPVMTQLLANKPDILCLDTCYADYVHPLIEQAFQQGYKGQIISCTLDFYQRLVERTSKEFMEGVIFQFPDFDDPALNDPRINFREPNKFYAEYVKRYGATEWSAVSWEYSSILDLWADAAQRAGSVEPAAVLAAMKEGGKGKHAFGEARWWGKELFGIDNALVGEWPVVVIRDGKATIAEFRSITDWWDKNSELMVKHMTDLGQMWSQRT